MSWANNSGCTVLVPCQQQSYNVSYVDGDRLHANNETMLRHFCQTGNLQGLKKIVPLVQVNGVDGGGNTPLHFAATNGHLLCVMELLKEIEIDCDVQNCKGSTPISCAASNGHDDICNVLLEAKASPHIANNHKNSPLASAAARGHAECVATLIRARVNVNHRNGSGSSALSLAAHGGHVDCVKLLTRVRRINLNVLTRQGLSPLALAASSGQVEVIECLLRAGANVNFCEVGGMTPLMMAVVQNRIECLPALIRGGATARMPTLLSGKNALTLRSKPETQHVLRTLVEERDRDQVLTLAEMFELGTRGDEGGLRGTPLPPRGHRRPRPPLFQSGGMWDIHLIDEIFGYVQELHGAAPPPKLPNNDKLQIEPLYTPKSFVPVFDPMRVVNPQFNFETQ